MASSDKKVERSTDAGDTFDLDTEDFQQEKIKQAWKRHRSDTSSSSGETIVQNRYGILNKVRLEELTNNVNKVVDTHDNYGKRENKSKKPPVIVITDHELTTTPKGMASLRELATESKSIFKISQFAKRAYIQPNTNDEHKMILNELKANKFTYYTYGIKDEIIKTKKIIIKNVSTLGATEADIREDLKKNYEIEPKKIVIYNSQRTILLIFENEISWQILREIRYVLQQKAVVEKFKTKTTAVLQCKNCWEFGHNKIHCGNKTTSEVSLIKDQLGRETKVCYNCGKSGHTARNAVCDKFQHEIKRKQEKREAFQKNNTKTEQTGSTRNLKSNIVKSDITYAAITSNKSTNNTENLLDTYIQEIRKSIDTHNIQNSEL